MRNLLQLLADRAEAIVAAALVLGIMALYLTGCAGLGEDLRGAALDTTAAVAPVALDGAANLGMGELQGTDADWETYGLGVAGLAATAFIGHLVRRRMLRRSAERRAEVTEG